MTHAATCDVEDRDGVCGAPTQAFLCSKHSDEMLFWLYDIGGLSLDERGDYLPSLLDELDITICRDDKVGGAPVGIVVRSGETGLALNMKASQAKDALKRCVRQWTLMFAEENQHLILDVATIEDAARWLSGFPNLLASHPSAVFMHTELGRCVRSARRCIDRPPPRQYIGKCDRWDDVAGRVCTRDLFVPPKVSVATCPDCESVHNVEARQDELFAKLRNKVAPAAQVVEALAFLGQRAHVKTLRTWIARGEIPNRTRNGGEPTVLVADVLDLLKGRGSRGVSTCTEAA